MRQTSSLALTIAAAGICGICWTGQALAQKGTGYNCTSGWPTAYQCEEFGTASQVIGSTSMQLWSVSQGYCYLAGIELTAHKSAYVTVSGANWVLDHSAFSAPAHAEAICVSYAGLKSPITGSFTYNGAQTLITTNANFCGLDGLLWTGTTNAPNFRAAYGNYPSTRTAANLYETITNGDTSTMLYSGCLVASNKLWWGTSAWIGSQSGQTVFQYGSLVGSYNPLNIPANNFICSFTSIYATSPNAPNAQLNVEDETGKWSVYAGPGNVATVACIQNPGP